MRLLSAGYVQLIQGTPLLGQLFVFFFALPLFGLSVDAWTAAAFSLSFYGSAFFGEIWRGSIQAPADHVDHLAVLETSAAKHV